MSRQIRVRARDLHFVVGRSGRVAAHVPNTCDLSESYRKKVDVMWSWFKAIIEPKANFRLSIIAYVRRTSMTKNPLVRNSLLVQKLVT